MPHVVVHGAPPLAEAVQRFEPIRATIGGCLVKIEQAYLERGRRLALLPAMTVAGPLRQRFFVLLGERDDGVAVRLESVTDPEKTEAVHLAIACVAEWLRRLSPGARFGATNLSPVLLRVDGIRLTPEP